MDISAYIPKNTALNYVTLKQFYEFVFFYIYKIREVDIHLIFFQGGVRW